MNALTKPELREIAKRFHASSRAEGLENIRAVDGIQFYVTSSAAHLRRRNAVPARGRGVYLMAPSTFPQMSEPAARTRRSGFMSFTTNGTEQADDYHIALPGV